MDQPHYYQHPRPEMAKYVPLSARYVLDSGCGSGKFIEFLKSRQSIQAVGIEMEELAAEGAKQYIEQVINGTIEDSLPLLLDKKFDIIVFNDVLEHLVNPWGTLETTRDMLCPGGAVVASIPNVRYWPILNRLFLHREWRYTDAGVLDRTHLRFFTELGIRDLFEKTGFNITVLEGINETPLPWKASILNRLFRGRFSDCRFPQFAVVAKPKKLKAI